MQLSVATLLADSARRHPDRIAVVEGELRLTYARLWDEVLVFAAVLRARGIGPGDRVAVLLANTADFPVPTTRSSRPVRPWCRCTH